MEAKKEDLVKRLEPTHLKEAVDATKGKAELEKQLEAPDEEAEKKSSKNDPKLNKKYPFKFHWKDGRGKVWKGDFVNEVLSIRQRQMVGVLRARMAAGVPIEALDEMTQEINLMVAHLTYSLVERPDWANDLQALDDIRLIQELYGEVLTHEATFLGFREPEAQS